MSHYLIKNNNTVSKPEELIMSSKIISVLICLFIFHLLAAGSVAGCEIGVYEIKNGDFSVKITNYGARIISVFLPDKNGMFLFQFSWFVFVFCKFLKRSVIILSCSFPGKIDDVVLGYYTVKEYIVSSLYPLYLMAYVIHRCTKHPTLWIN